MTSGAPGRDRIGLKQFRAEGCLSYVVHDRATKEAAIIDPIAEFSDSYRQYALDQGLNVVAVLETHTHADHHSGAAVLKSLFTKLREGPELTLGKLRFARLETPGHTPDSACFAGEGLLFSGDTLWIGATGDTLSPGADAAKLWDSIQKKIATLPSQTILLPGHDYNELVFSTLEAEKTQNPHWAMKKEAFIEAKAVESKASAGKSWTVTPARVASISVEKFKAKLEAHAQGTLFLDVREPEEFHAGHIPGTINIPVSEVPLCLDYLRSFKRIYVACHSGRRSGFIVNTLSYLGFPDAVNVIGGYQHWTYSGYPVEEENGKKRL